MSKPSFRYDPKGDHSEQNEPPRRPNTGAVPFGLVFLFLMLLLAARTSALLAMKIADICGYDPRKTVEVIEDGS